MRNYAAMVALVDKDVGRLMQKLQELGIANDTLVFFSSDNGANKECIEQLGSTGGLSGYKRSLYEGGIRTPFIASWPGKIQPGTTSDLVTSFVDFLPTAADVIGAPAPSGSDGISILPTLIGKEQSKLHDALYFEIYEPYFQQSARLGDWKGYRLGTKAPLELYDLKADPAETTNLAAAHQDIVSKIEAIMAAQHTPSPHYDAPEQSQKDMQKPLKKKKKVKSVPEMLNEENEDSEPDKK
jgi:arylsulfatase A-like enzyme